MLVCDDDPSVLRVYQRLMDRKKSYGIVHYKLSSNQDIGAALPHEKMAASAENSILILNFVEKFTTAQAVFSLITDGEFAPGDQMVTGHNLILELQKLFPQIEATMITGNPDRFSKLAAEHGYTIIAKPPAMEDVVNLINRFFQL